jgi:ADP-heptose:LPS heptosyltransferase
MGKWELPPTVVHGKAGGNPLRVRRAGAAMTDVLIIKPSSLGDILNGLQLAATLKAGRPDLRISWVVADAFAPVVRDCLTVDRVFVFTRKGGLGGFVRLLRELRRERFDVVLDLQGLARSGLMTWAARAPRKVGRSDSREGAGLFYSETVPLPEGRWREHSVAILLEFCRVFGVPPLLAGRVAFRPPAEFRHEAHFAKVAGRGPVLMFPDSRGADREWPGFAELTRRFLSTHSEARVVWLGQKVLPSPEGVDPARFVNLMGATTLPEVIAALPRAALVVANDSGPMHLAAALGVRTLSLFGPTRADMRAPYPPDGDKHTALDSPDGTMAGLSVDAVSAALDAAWTRAAAG